MSQYRVSWAMQGDAASSIGTAISDMEVQLAEVNRQMNALIATGDSDAQQAYLTRQQQWNSAAENIKSAVMQFQQGMTRSADISSSTEATNVGVVSA